MNIPFNNIALIGKFQDREMREHIVALAEFLRARHLHVLLETETARCCEITDYPIRALTEFNGDIDLAIVLGGDGTMLGVARALLEHQVPLLGINRGRIGFLTDISAQNMLEDVAKVLAGDYSIEQRLMLQTKILRKGKLLGEGVALNDVVISKGELAQLLGLEVMIDEQFVHRQRSDGLIVATPTGTTAYALSAGGPILHSALEAITLVPICPHTLSNRPIVIKSTSQVHVKLVDQAEARIHFDGQLIARLYQYDDVYIARAEKMTRLLHPNGHCHYEMLRKKLHWG